MLFDWMVVSHPAARNWEIASRIRGDEKRARL
jgi:hypothetical protein